MEVQASNLQDFNNNKPSNSKIWFVFPKKYWVILILILAFLLLGVVWLFFKNYSSQNNKRSVNLKDYKQKTDSKEINAGFYEQSHPTLYFVKLEYDPVNNLTTEISTAKVQSDPPIKQSSQPEKHPDLFIYKVEVLDSNKIIESGWYQLLKKGITTSNNTYLFTIYTTYSPKKFIRITLPDKTVIWSGKMP